MPQRIIISSRSVPVLKQTCCNLSLSGPNTLYRLLTPENRCLVPANSFAEYAPEPNPETKKKEVVWFALNEDRQLFAFAGI
jgi:hypothetical protein